MIRTAKRIWAGARSLGKFQHKFLSLCGHRHRHLHEMSFISIYQSLYQLVDECHSKFVNHKYQVIDFFVIAVLFALFGALYLECTDIHAFRHDSYVVMKGSNITPLVISEGRWFNWIFFPIVKHLNPQICIFLSLVLWGYFAYIVAKRFTNDRNLRIITVLLFMQIPSYYSIIGWPLVIFTAVVLIALSAYAVEHINYKAFFILFGILFLGSHNNFYNLLLLLFIRDVGQFEFKKTLKLLLWWVIGFLVGYLVMLVMVKLIGGHWGLQIADWRKPHPVHEFNDLFINIKVVWQSLLSNLTLVSFSRTVYYLLGFCAVACLLNIVIHRNESSIKALLAFACIIAVALAGYVQSIPLGLFVVTRTATGLYAAVFLLTILLCTYSRNTGFVFVLLVGCFAFLNNYNSIRYYTGVTNAWRDSFKSMNINPAATRLTHVCSTTAEVAQSERMIMQALQLRNGHQEGFGLNWRQLSILHSVGFINGDTNLGLCEKYKNLPRQENQLHSWVYADKQLFIWYK